MEELLKQILSEIRETKEEIKEEIKEIKENMATIDELKRVADTLETIAVGEAAATKEKLEDKIEAGDVVLKSLIDGLENRTNKRFDQLEDTLKQVLQGIETIAGNQQTTAEILSAFSNKFQRQDDIIDLLNREVQEQKRQTLVIRRKLDQLDAS